MAHFARRDLELWRAYVPRWSYAPLSGDGAARFGGRWNPVGAPTIYAALEMSTAWAEYNQGFVQHPALIARLQLTEARIADLTDGPTLSALGVDRSILVEDWRDIVDRGGVPQAHLLRERLLADGVEAAIFPSFMSPGGGCIAIWRWNGPGGAQLSVIDPDGRLPKTPASWV